MTSTNNYLREQYLKISNLFRKSPIFIYLLAFVLIALPAKNLLLSIATILLVISSLPYFRTKNFNFKLIFLFPIFYFVLMTLSLIWTKESALSLVALQKGIPLFMLPILFLFLPRLSKIDLLKIIRFYSIGMVFFAIYFLSQAFLKYLDTKQIGVFFYHELVTQDLNAIYVSVFSSFAIFYFIALEKIENFEKLCLSILIIFVFLLSSKSIITIDFILFICYYSFFSKTQKSIRTATLLGVSIFLIVSLFFVKNVRDRFLIEYETAFVDNTLNKKIGNNVYNVSIKQAWKMDKFQQNHFFPGAALRVYQLRVFFELLKEEKIIFKGFGLEASQENLRKKASEHNLYLGYGEFNYHNQYLQSFSDLGIFGFILLLFMLFYNLKNALKYNDFLHLVFALSMIILFVTESFFCRQRGIVFFITLYCLFNSVETTKEIKKTIP